MSKYEIIYLKLENGKRPFMDWFIGLDKLSRQRVESRLMRIQEGKFGDFKSLNADLYELRLKFGCGYRVYYTIYENKVIILLTEGINLHSKKI